LQDLCNQVYPGLLSEIGQLAEHRLAAGIELDQVGIFIEAVLAAVEPMGRISYSGRNCAIRPTSSCSRRLSTAKRQRSRRSTGEILAWCINQFVATAVAEKLAVAPNPPPTIP
jgi:hypothetical protein